MSHDFIVPQGGGVKLGRIDPADTGDVHQGNQTDAKMAADIRALEQLQELLYVASDRAVLIVLQGMDTSGKDGTIKHVFSGVNPEGVGVVSFKQPTELELAHDYLWRIHNACPRMGEIVIFNRSHYESVLVERVMGLTPKPVWSQRYEQINQFEAMLAASGTIILKFFLYISKAEQKQRLEERIHKPDKRWKVNVSDWQDRKRWADFMAAYEDVLNKTSTDYAPWYIIPADHKWYRNYLVADILTARLSPYRDDWQQAIEQRGAANLKALEQSGAHKISDE
jgi:PPK2 family polyphosphate:nucleotide phosphotransferase